MDSILQKKFGIISIILGVLSLSYSHKASRKASQNKTQFIEVNTMRTIEKQIIKTIGELSESQKPKTVTLSIRDKVVCNGICVAYYLWDTCLFAMDIINGEESFFISSIGGCPASNTTKSRLNAILSYRHNMRLSQKNFELFCNEKQIETDTKYRIVQDDFIEIK